MSSSPAFNEDGIISNITQWNFNGSGAAESNANNKDLSKAELHEVLAGKFNK